MANGILAVSQLEMLTQSGTGIITVVPPATNTNRTITLPDVTGTVVASGTTPSLNGIQFPATQSASADANTLDDYEEGTWTVADASGASLSISTNFAFYTKIGDLIYATCDITYPSTSSSVELAFTLPFSGRNYANGFVGYTSYTTSAIYLESSNNTNKINILTSAFAALLNSNFSGKRLIATFVYKIS